MNWARLGICLLVSLPAGWFAGVLYDRVPSRLPLFRPFPWPDTSGTHLTIHVLTALCFALAAVRFDDAPWLRLAGYLVFFTTVVALSAIDLETLRLPDRIVGGALVISIPLVTVASLVDRSPAQIRYALLGGVFYFGFLLLTHLAFPRGMGFGDVKLAALLGLYVGWLGASGVTSVSLVLYAMLVGFLGGSGIGVVLFAFRRRSRAYPFGPFLVAGTILVITFSQQLLPAGGV
jgi:leader peptidase (prepilin peptidase)/N-methyltransferase